MAGERSESLPSRKRAKSPASSAERLLENVKFITDDTDTVYRHNGAFWDALSDATLRQIALEADLGKSTRARRAEIIDEIKARSHIRGMEWGRVADYEIPFKNGVVDVRSGQMRGHRPEDYLERVLPHDFMPDVVCPVWQKVLFEWFGDAEEESGGPIAALQEFFGYVCMSHARYKKALLVKGESDTGKGLIATLLAEMVGRDRVCALPLEKMDDLQARDAIVGKALNLMTEIAAQALIADGGFKQMISLEEPIQINAKYKPIFTYWPTAKHVFLTNNLPGLSDRTEAVLNRLLVIPMTRIFKKSEQDETLPAKLKAEIVGVLAWSVQGAKRLYERGGKFTEIASGAEVIDELRRRANPAIDFVRERLKAASTAALPLENLIGPFNHWKGGTKVTKKGLGSMLRSAGHVVKDVRYGKAVLASLVGFERITEETPAMLLIKEGDATSAEQVIDATEGIRYDGATNEN